MESLATVLRRVPIFADLPPGTFARIIADLREESHPRGAVICREGEEARDFYIIKSGEVEVMVADGTEQHKRIAVSRAHEWFGERALFSDRPRSATVVARTPVELWRLTKEKFDGLIEENPWLILHFTGVIGDRLYETNQQLSKLQAAFGAQLDSLFRAEPPVRQDFLMRTAVLTVLDAAVIGQLLGCNDAAGVLRDLATSDTWVCGTDGALTHQDGVREFLLGRLRARLGADEARVLAGRAASLCERARRWDCAIEHYLDAQDAGNAARLLAARVDEFDREGRAELVDHWLRRLPAGSARDISARRWRAGDHTASSAQASQRVRDTVRSAATRRPLAALAGIAASLLIWALPPPSGVQPAAMHMLALLAWAAVFWAFDVLPDYVVGLCLIIGWIVFAIVPAEVAVSGFTAGPFFLIIGVLGIAASLQASGLLFRLALQVLRRFPLTHRGQAMGLALSGTCITPGIPDVTSGVAIAAPIILALSDSLGYARRSNGSAGLAMAAVLGFGQMSPFFLTGAAENLLAWGLLPEAARAQISWGSWALAALPLAIVTFALGFGATLFLLPPESQPTISRGLIGTQIQALGPPSRAELINGAVLIAAILGWISAPYHHIDVAWVAVGAMTLLLGADLLDRTTFRAGIQWDFIFFLGAVLSLTEVVRHLGIDAWIIRALAPVLEPMAPRPTQFLLFVALAVFAARFVLPSLPLVSLLIVTVVPIAAHAHISPLALTLVICTTVSVWFLPYQSTYYLALYFGTKERAFNHGQVRLLAWSYGVIYLLAILLAIPYWRLLGLVP
jgi:anion transporter